LRRGPLCLWIGAALLGVAYAGGSITFHLGHNYFSPRSQALEYMGVHVTLSGIRGLVAPLLGMAVYQAVEAAAPGHGAWALLMPLLLCTSAVLGFARLAAVEPEGARGQSEESAAVAGPPRAGPLDWLAVLVAIAGVLAAGQPARGADISPEPTGAGLPHQAQGFLVYCPCMGRFGNQVDQLLGTMAAARASGRTLVLPPFIEYEGRETRFVPFEKYFSVAAVRELVQAIPMEQFMTDPALAASLWPAAQRRLYCPRGGVEHGCRMPVGNPPATFWDHFGITFAGSVAADATAESLARTLPPEQHPVIALADSPGSYPVAAENRDLQRYLRWSEDIRQQGDAFLSEHLIRPFLAVHLRNGSEWQQACRSAVGRHEFMSSPQCGLSDAAAAPMPTITQAQCLPRPDDVVRTIRVAQQHFGPFRTVFVGTDADDYRPQLEAALGDVRVVRGGTPHLDLYVFAQADLFIGNCISSFTAFAARERRVHGRPSLFFGFEQ
jgi:peptide-O-fucosyltransferase